MGLKSATTIPTLLAQLRLAPSCGVELQGRMDLPEQVVVVVLERASLNRIHLRNSVGQPLLPALVRREERLGNKLELLLGGQRVQL